MKDTNILTEESKIERIYSEDVKNNFGEINQKGEKFEIIKFLIENNQACLPVVPKQDALKYPRVSISKGKLETITDKEGNLLPKFNGKSPSFFVGNKFPVLMSYKQFKQNLPTLQDLKTWFKSPDVGIGMLCNDSVVCVDVDVKNLSESEKIETINRFKNHELLKNTWMQDTASGGLHVFVKVKNYTEKIRNFCLDNNKKHIGEIISKGEFVVIHRGDDYKQINLGQIATIDNLGDLGISSVSDDKKSELSSENKRKKISNAEYKSLVPTFPIKISVEKLFSRKTQDLLVGNTSGDRSKDLTRILREFYGWQNFLATHGISIYEDITNILDDGAESLGIDIPKSERILDSVQIANNLPSIFYEKGDLGCWEKIRDVDFQVFLDFCPSDIKGEMSVSPTRIDDFVEYLIEGEKIKFSKPVKIKRIKNWINWLKFTPDIEINQEKFLMPDLPESGNIFCINSPMGTGKTEGSLNAIKQKYDKDSKGIFWISARNNLLYQVISKAQNFGIQMWHLNDDHAFKVEELEDDSLNICFCTESIAKVSGHFHGKDIYIDEINTVLNQILSGGTVSGVKQGRVLKVFREMLEQANNVYCLDANLNNRTAKLLQDLCPDKKLIKVKNTAKGRKASFTIVNSHKLNEKSGELKYSPKDFSWIINTLKNENVKPFIVTDSRKNGDALENILKPRLGFNLNQETSKQSWIDWKKDTEKLNDRHHLSENWAEELLSNPNIFCDSYNPDFFIGSPTIENGFSYFGNHFNCKVGIFLGVLGVSGITQMLFRNRNNEIPCYVYCPKKSIVQKTRNLALNSQLDYQVSVMINQRRYAGKNRFKLRDLAYQKLDKDFWEYYSDLQDIEVFESENLQDCLVHRLSEFGHEITICDEEKITESAEKFKEVKQNLLEKEATEVLEAIPFESDEDLEQAKKNNPGKLTSRRISKHYLLKKLPGIEDTKSWNVDFIAENWVSNQKLINQVENRWFLENPSSIEDKYFEFIEFQNISCEFIVPTKLVNKKEITKNILWEIGLRDLYMFLLEGGEIYKDSPNVTRIVKSCKSKIVRNLQIDVLKNPPKNNEENIKFIKKLLKSIGVSLTKPEKKLTDKGRQRFYRIDFEELENQSDIWHCIERKWRNWLEEKYVQVSEQDWEYVKLHNELPSKFSGKADDETSSDINPESVAFISVGFGNSVPVKKGENLLNQLRAIINGKHQSLEKFYLERGQKLIKAYQEGVKECRDYLDGLSYEFKSILI